MMRSTTAAALFVLLFCGCDEIELGSERAKKSFVKTWPSEGIRQIQLQSVHGDIEVRPATQNEIRLVVDARFSGRDAIKTAKSEFLKMTVENGVLKIEEKGKSSRGRLLRFKRGRHIDFKIEAPSSIAVDITNVNGEIDVIDIAASSELRTVNGEIDVVSRGAEIEASSVNGSIEATFKEKFLGAKLSTVNGAVEVTVPALASFVCKVSQVNGGFESNIPVQVRRRGRGGINAVVGDGDGSKTLHVTTVNGDVALIREDGGDLELPQPRPVTTAGDEPAVEVPALPPLPEFPSGGGGAPEPPQPPKPYTNTR